MPSRFKKFGQSLQKGARSVSNAFHKGSHSHDSKSKGDTKSHTHSEADKKTDAGTELKHDADSHAGSAKAVDVHSNAASLHHADTALNTEDTATHADTHSSASPDKKEKDKRETGSLKFSRTSSPAKSRTSAPVSPRPPTPAAKAVSIQTPRDGSEIEFALDDDNEKSKMSTTAPGSPAGKAPPPVPSTRSARRPGTPAVGVTPTVEDEARTAPLSVAKTQTHGASPSESHLSVHGSDRGSSSALRSDLSNARGDAGSIQFELESSVRGERAAGGGAANSKAAVPRQVSAVSQRTNSIVFNLDSEDEVAGGDAAAGKPVSLASSTVLQPDPEDNDGSDILFNMDSEKDDAKEEVVDVDVASTVKSIGGGAAEKKKPLESPSADDERAPQSKRRASKSAKNAAASNQDSDEDLKKRKKADGRPSHRSSSRTKGKKAADSDNDREESKKHRTRSDSRKGSAEAPRRHRHRRKAASPPLSVGVNDDDDGDADRHSSVSAGAPHSARGRQAAGAGTPRNARSGSRKKRGDPSSVPAKDDSSSSSSSSSSASRRDGGVTQASRDPRGSGMANKPRSRERHSGRVADDVNEIFEQVRRDAQAMERRRRKASPPSGRYAARQGHVQQQRSSGTRLRMSPPRSGRLSGRLNNDYSNVLESRHGSRGSLRHRSRELPARTLSPRGKYSGVRHGDYYYASNNQGDEVASYVSDADSCSSAQRPYYPAYRRGSAGENRSRANRADAGYVETPPRNSSARRWRTRASDGVLSPGPEMRRTPSPRRQRAFSPQAPSSGRGGGRGGIAAPERSGASLYLEPSPLRRANRFASPAAVEYHLTRSPPPGQALETEAAILAQVEYKLDLLAEQMAYSDFVLEQDMLSSPFERLYHMNNKQDRKDRAELLQRFSKLQAIREKIVTGALDREIAEKEEHQRKQEEMLRDPNNIFMRLYQSPRRRGEELERDLNAEANGSAAGSKFTTPRRSRGDKDGEGGTGGDSSRRSGSGTRTAKRTRADQEAYFSMVYNNALAGMKTRREVAETAQRERADKEYEEFLVARLAGQLQRRSPSRTAHTMPPDQIEVQARQRLAEERKGSAEKSFTDELVHGRRLTAGEQEKLGTRLTRQGFQSKESLSERREKEVMKECTFRPQINAYRPAAYSSASWGNRDDSYPRASAGRDGGRYDDDRSATGSSQSGESGADGRESKYDELYRKGMESKDKVVHLQEQKDRELRLRILKSRLSEDHHFRRRVELDPSLAERFMRSLAI